LGQAILKGREKKKRERGGNRRGDRKDERNRPG
jgi:hypothetical protein